MSDFFFFLVHIDTCVDRFILDFIYKFCVN